MALTRIYLFRQHLVCFGVLFVLGYDWTMSPGRSMSQSVCPCRSTHSLTIEDYHSKLYRYIQHNFSGIVYQWLTYFQGHRCIIFFLRWSFINHLISTKLKVHSFHKDLFKIFFTSDLWSTFKVMGGYLVFLIFLSRWQFINCSLCFKFYISQELWSFRDCSPMTFNLFARSQITHLALRYFLWSFLIHIYKTIMLTKIPEQIWRSPKN